MKENGTVATEKRLIDANALLELLRKFEPPIQGKHDLIGMVEHAQWASICEAIADAPTVDAVEVVHGRWKYYHKQNIAVCTNCSFERNLDANFGRAISCPNCGAKMDGDGND